MQTIYTNLPSYSILQRYGFIETTGPKQAKEGTVRFEGKSKRNAIVHYLYWPKDGYVQRKNPSGAGGVNILGRLSPGTQKYDQAFQMMIANIEGKDKKPAEEKVGYLDQMYRAKQKTFWFLFNTKWPSFEEMRKVDSRYDNLPGDKQLHKFMKDRQIIEKGKDY